MARVAEYLKDEPIAAIYSSPLRRAWDSARILAEKLLGQGGGAPPPDGRGSEKKGKCRDESRHGTLKRAPQLCEIDFGDFEGLAYHDIEARYPELYRQWMETPTEVRFPKGESFCEMRSRVLGAFDAIQRERRGQTVAIVSHGGVNRILIAWALEIPDQCLFRVAQDYAGVNLLEIADGNPSVKLMNHRAT
jgi:broad specificity phosphatase PhoE